MSNEKNSADKSRRGILKSLVAGSAVVSGSKALPEKWSTPLTNTILLPSHAQTTGDFTVGDKYRGVAYDGYLGKGGDYSFGDYAYDDGTDDPTDGDQIVNDGVP